MQSPNWNGVAAEILKYYPKEGDGKLYNIESYEPYFNGIQMSPPKYPVPYQGVDEFFQLNPNCCRIVQYYTSPYPKESGERISFFDKVTGRKTGIVTIQYHIRYKAQNGEVLSKPWDYAVAVNACGELVWDF